MCNHNDEQLPGDKGKTEVRVSFTLRELKTLD